MEEVRTLGDYVDGLPKRAKTILGVLLLPLACLLVIMTCHELITRSGKTFQDTGGLTIVYSMSVLGPLLARFLPRVRILHWIPVFLLGGLQCLFIAIGKPMNEWWLIAEVAPFTIGTSLAALLLYKRWFAPRFSLPS
jgi:hypothetical protein